MERQQVKKATVKMKSTSELQTINNDRCTTSQRFFFCLRVRSSENRA